MANLSNIKVKLLNKDIASIIINEPKTYNALSFKNLEDLIKAVDYVSMHTYAYHNSHYNPSFWTVPDNEQDLSDTEKVDNSMLRALNFAKMHYNNVKKYVNSIDSTKTIHIGETGWATISSGHYGVNGSRATDEYKQGLYFKHLREWTNEAGISCFYFEAFDEQWKDCLLYTSDAADE